MLGLWLVGCGDGFDKKWEGQVGGGVVFGLVLGPAVGFSSVIMGVMIWNVSQWKEQEAPQWS